MASGSVRRRTGRAVPFGPCLHYHRKPARGRSRLDTRQSAASEYDETAIAAAGPAGAPLSRALARASLQE